MQIDAEFVIKIKLTDITVPNNISGIELKKRLHEEGEKRLRYYTSGYLLDPDGKVITKDINYKIKED